MPTKILSGAVNGINGVIVEAETDITPSLPAVVIVGLPDTAVQEARERVKSAIKNSGFKFPRGRVAVNLAPADLPKTGSLYDLPIAVSILVEAGLIGIDPKISKSSVFLGELALDGRVRPVNGTLPISIAAAKDGIKNIFVPKANAAEASLIKNADIFPIESLFDLIAHLEERKKLAAIPAEAKQKTLEKYTIDFADVAGQETAKRALMIAAAGHHNILFTGPPGSGKTMLARALQSILPPLSNEELIEVTKIYSIAGLLTDKSGISLARPFRSPHHTSSRIALVGGGSVPKPGEVTLAHKGVLFLDEFPEFPRSSMESLRQPIEDGVVTVSRATGTSVFPADFILVAAQNPCPCGNYGHPKLICQCSDGAVRKYQTRISGPMLDRIDLIAEVPHQPFESLSNPTGPKSGEIRPAIEKAKTMQSHRFGRAKTNSRLTPAEIKEHCRLDTAGRQLLSAAVNKMNLSGRAYHRILKTSRTIADLEGSENILPEHVSEALQYRWKQE